MKKLIALVLLLSPLLSAGQTTFSTGLLLDDDDYRQIAVSSEEIQVRAGQKSFPNRIDLTNYCPPVRHQGDVASCVGWAAGYAAMTIENAVTHSWTRQRVSEEAHSALFIYNQLTDRNCGGIRLPDALKMLQEQGNCLARDFDTDVQDCQRQATPDLLAKAQENRLIDYIRLFDPDDSAGLKVDLVRMVLAQQKPVIVGMRILNNFYQIRPGEDSWIPSIGDISYAGGHAMVVVGYDDNRYHPDRIDVAPAMRGAFKLMNSWGEQWGDNGFIWVRYGHFAHFCRHAYAIVTQGQGPVAITDPTTREEPSTQARKMSGFFSIKRYTGDWFEGQPLFVEEPVKRHQQYYLVDGMAPGDQLQLKVTTDFDGGYLYVFSIDPDGKQTLHFPRSGEYSTRFKGRNESALVMTSGSDIVIPGPDKVLTIAHAGEDLLLVLFSESRIKPSYLHQLADQISQAQGDVSDRLGHTLGRHMVPARDIRYYDKEMGFEAQTTGDGRIVPLILKIRSR